MFYPDPHARDGAASPLQLTAFGDDEFFEFTYDDGARFVTDSAGTRLWAERSPSLSIDYLTTYVRGPLIGFALRRRGITALHASAAQFGPRAVVFCGPQEAGKSTIAAILALQGIPILSDDIVVLRPKDTVHVEPGYPWICLWPDTALHLFGRSDGLPLLTQNWEKRYLPLSGSGFASVEQPLGAIYMISPRVSEPNAPRVEDISPREAVLELVKNTYMNWLLDAPQRAAEFEVLTALVSRVPVRRLIAHADPLRIGLLRDLIIRDSENLIGSYVRPMATRQ